MDLTARQQKIYEALSGYIQEQGYPPSQRELARKVGLRSPNTIDYHLKKLEQKGWIKCPKNRFRAIELVEKNGGRSNTVSVPVLGTVPAGLPQLALQEQDEFIELDQSLVRGKVFALCVKGDSMKDAGILEGDLVVVRIQPTAQNGEIVVARFEDEATVKFLRSLKGSFYLVPANEKYQPIPLKGAEIVGKVVSVIRKY